MKVKKYDDYKNTQIISAFPGCGKSHLYKNNGDKIILDSDSSKFDKTNFPQNYIQHIKDNIGKADIILVSSHKEVRDELVKNNIDFTLVYPQIDTKLEYIERYIQRGSPESFINLLNNNWENWISELEAQTNCKKLVLKGNQYLSDVIQ